MAVIGVGTWGKNHAATYKLLPMAHLIAVCDINRRRAENAAKQFDATPYVDVCEVLKREDVRAVSICTSWSDLGKTALQALEAGKHVLVEKPMAASVEEAQKIQETAKQRGLVLTVGFLMRFVPAVQYIKKREKEIFNCFTRLESRRTSGGPDNADSRVGVIRDLAVHDIDLARYLFNDEPIRVYARVGRMEAIDHVEIELIFNNEKKAFIESSWIVGPRNRTLTVIGTKCRASLDFSSQQLIVENLGATVQPDCVYQDPLELELEDFVSCIIHQRQPLLSGVDGIRTLQIVDATIESSRRGKAVDMNNFHI